MKNKAFTLIELLVVIVIIGILATISTATFSGSFAQARDVERQSFIRDAGQIVLGYGVSNNGKNELYSDLDGNNSLGDPIEEVEGLRALLQENGRDLVVTKNGYDIFFMVTNGGAANFNNEFVLAMCSEAREDEMFILGSSDEIEATIGGCSNSQKVPAALPASGFPNGTSWCDIEFDGTTVTTSNCEFDI